jgi:hypothetical protein
MRLAPLRFTLRISLHSECHEVVTEVLLHHLNVCATCYTLICIPDRHVITIRLDMKFLPRNTHFLIFRPHSLVTQGRVFILGPCFSIFIWPRSRSGSYNPIKIVSPLPYSKHEKFCHLFYGIQYC